MLSAAAAIAARAQTFTVLYSFGGTNGETPYAGLVRGANANGDLYGTTYYGGTHGNGMIFKIGRSGTSERGIYNFCSRTGCTDGSEPYLGALVQATDGNLYGTTFAGGANSSCAVYGTTGCGTAFKITPGGMLTTLHSFDSMNGANPAAGLAEASSGDLYGTTQYGGARNDGTVFMITQSGTLTTLYSFCSQSSCADGSSPEAEVVQGRDGDFYGTTYGGGRNGTCAAGGCGTVFKITKNGILTTLHAFAGTDGANPSAGLIQATDGYFYGTTYGGGANSSCILYGMNEGCGTVFKITPSGMLTTLYSFCSQNDCTDGEFPVGGLVQATDGNFYGTAFYGGKGVGTIFKIAPNGTLTTLYSFCSQLGCTDGSEPTGTLVQDTDGNLYGTTSYGGGGGCLNGCGAVFSLSVGLDPFVETLPASGKVGAAVKILGSSLKGATSVTFNGTAAVFKVESPSLIRATVPEGATTGTVQVVAPGGTLSSNVPFRVIQ